MDLIRNRSETANEAFGNSPDGVAVRTSTRRGHRVLAVVSGGHGCGGREASRPVA